jgi:hypothetical protein
MMAIERQTTMFTIYSLNDSAWDNGKASTNPKESNQKFYPNRDVHPLWFIFSFSLRFLTHLRTNWHILLIKTVNHSNPVRPTRELRDRNPNELG